MNNKKNYIEKIIFKKAKQNNKKAFESFDYYKKTIEILDRANLAMGKKKTYKTTQSSTLNYKIGIHGISSTQKI